MWQHFLAKVSLKGARKYCIKSRAHKCANKSFAKEKNGQKQVKKRAFKINAKIEDVGLNED